MLRMGLPYPDPFLSYVYPFSQSVIQWGFGRGSQNGFASYPLSRGAAVGRGGRHFGLTRGGPDASAFGGSGTLLVLAPADCSRT